MAQAPPQPRAEPNQLDLLRQVMAESTRELLETLAPAKPPSRPFAEAADRWEKVCLPELSATSHEDIRSTLKRLKASFGERTAIDKQAVEDFLLDWKGKRSVRTLNKWRAQGMQVLARAIEDKQWHGENGFELAAPLKQRKVKGAVMSPAEAARFIDEQPELLLQTLMAAAIYTGGRKGELLSWKREDIDLRKAQFGFFRSWDNDVTKNGEQRSGLPIHRELLPYLEALLESHQSEWVFPHPKGGRARKDWDLAAITKSSLKRAEIVEGYDHRCYKGCKRVERHDDSGVRFCDACGKRLWASAIPRAISFHGLRRVSATLYKEAGCDNLVRKLLLGHAVKDITDGVYTTLGDNFMRREIEKLSLRAEPPLGGAPSDCGGGSTPDHRTSNPRAGGSNPSGRTLFSSTPKLSPREVAEALNVCSATAYRMIAKGAIKCTRVGALIRVSQTDLEEFIKKGGSR